MNKCQRYTLRVVVFFQKNNCAIYMSPRPNLVVLFVQQLIFDKINRDEKLNSYLFYTVKLNCNIWFDFLTIWKQPDLIFITSFFFITTKILDLRKAGTQFKTRSSALKDGDNIIYFQIVLILINNFSCPFIVKPLRLEIKVPFQIWHW